MICQPAYGTSALSPSACHACLAPSDSIPRCRDHWIDLSAGGAPARSSLKLPEAQIFGSDSSWAAQGARTTLGIRSPSPPLPSPLLQLLCVVYTATASSSNRIRRTRPARLAGASAKIRNTRRSGALPSLPTSFSKSSIPARPPACVHSRWPALKRLVCLLPKSGSDRRCCSGLQRRESSLSGARRTSAYLMYMDCILYICAGTTCLLIRRLVRSPNTVCVPLKVLASLIHSALESEACVMPAGDFPTLVAGTWPRTWPSNWTWNHPKDAAPTCRARDSHATSRLLTLPLSSP